MLQGILFNLPSLLVCAAAVAVVLSRSRQLRGAVHWALLGFGLSLFVCVVSPITWPLVWRFLGPRVFNVLLSVFWSLVHAASYGCLLLAVLAGRETTPPIQPPVDPLARPRL